MDVSTTLHLARLVVPKEEERKRDQAVAGAPARPAENSDEALMGQVSGGGTEALSVLFHRYAGLVRGIAYKILRDDSEADDALQEVFLFLHRKSSLFDHSKNSARSWIVQVTYHRAIDRRRYLQSRHFYTQVDLEDVARELGDTGNQRAIGRLEHERLRKLFHSLSRNQRETLHLFFFDGLTLDEIALKLSQTRGNVKNHYFRGLDKLRKQLLPPDPITNGRCDGNVVRPEKRVRLADDPARQESSGRSQDRL
jgi:RNA polymerase sigma-70 factor, ECF subfamily